MIYLPQDEVAILDGKIIVYRANMDLLIYMAGSLDENELLLATALDTFCDSLLECLKYVWSICELYFCRPQLDKRTFLENYDTAALILDDCLDNGYPLNCLIMQYFP